jgi:transposase
MPPIRLARAPVAPRRRLNCQLDAYMRTKLVELRTVAGWTDEQIYKEYPCIPVSKIKTTVYRANKRVKNETLPRSRRPRKLTEDDKTKLLDAIDANPRITYDDLLTTIDNKVKRTSVWRLLHEEGRRKWLVLDRPSLTPIHTEARLT